MALPDIDLKSFSPEDFANLQNVVAEEYARRKDQTFSELALLGKNDFLRKNAKLGKFGPRFGQILRSLGIIKGSYRSGVESKFNWDGGYPFFEFKFQPKQPQIIKSLIVNPFWHDFSSSTLLGLRITHNQSPFIDVLYGYPVMEQRIVFGDERDLKAIQAEEVGKSLINQPTPVKLALIDELIDFMTPVVPGSGPEA